MVLISDDTSTSDVIDVVVVYNVSVRCKNSNTDGVSDYFEESTSNFIQYVQDIIEKKYGAYINIYKVDVDRLGEELIFYMNVDSSFTETDLQDIFSTFNYYTNTEIEDEYFEDYGYGEWFNHGERWYTDVQTVYLEIDFAEIQVVDD